MTATRYQFIASPSLIALISSACAWELRWAPLKPGGSWLALKAVFLLAPLFGILRLSLGSGFIITGDGYIITNAHVIEDADEILVRLVDKREYRARVIGADRRSDIAVIRIDAEGLPVVSMGQPDAFKVGEWVVAIGSPFGFEHSVTAGIVSAKGRSLPDENFMPFIQTDVAINPGNSGGPLFNLKGEVVGVNSQIYSQTGGFMGLSFAIPIDVAMDVQSQLRNSGVGRRRRIGVAIKEVTRVLAATPDGFAFIEDWSAPPEQISIMIAKGDEKFRETANAALKGMMDNGKFEENYNAWFMVPPYNLPMPEALRNQIANPNDKPIGG